MADLRPTSGSLAPSGTFDQYPISAYGNPPMGSNNINVNTPVITSQAGLPSNTTIVKSYMSSPWKGGLDKDIVEGDVLLVVRSKNNNVDKRRFDYHAFLNLGQANIILRQFYVKGTEQLEDPNNSNKSGLEEMKNSPENQWNYKRYGETWRKLGLNPQTEYIKGLYKDGIREKFNILGALVNDNNGAYNSSLTSGKNVNFKILNVGLKNITYVRNYWGGNAVPSTILWIILKRIYNNITEQYEEFAFVPHVTNKGDMPSMSIRQYYDLNENLQYGDCFYFGEVLDNEYTSPNNDVIRKACGLLGTMEDQKAKNYNLKKIKVNITAPPKRKRWF
jgi:hypothetical protein